MTRGRKRQLPVGAKAIHINLAIDVYADLVRISRKENRSVSGQVEWIVRQWYEFMRDQTVGSNLLDSALQKIKGKGKNIGDERKDG